MEPLPPFPAALNHVWWCFQHLAGTRQPGMAGQAPITYAEIDAFNRTTLAGLTAWEVRLIRRVDDRVLDVAAGVFDPTPKAQKRGIGSFLKQKAAESRKRKEKGKGDTTPPA